MEGNLEPGKGKTGEEEREDGENSASNKVQDVGDEMVGAEDALEKRKRSQSWVETIKIELEKGVVQGFWDGLESDGEGRYDESKGGEKRAGEREKRAEEPGGAVPRMQDEKGGKGRDGREDQFRFCEENKRAKGAWKEKADRKTGKRRQGGKPAEGGVEGEKGEEGKEKTTGDFVGVGGEKVVISDEEIAGEGEEEDEAGDGKDGGKGGCDAAEDGAEGEESGEPESEVEREEGVDGGAAEEGEEGGVGIDGNGAEVVGEVAVEDVAAENAPGEVEFAGEVDEGVGPGEPGGAEHEGGEEGVEEEFEEKGKTGGTAVTEPGKERKGF